MSLLANEFSDLKHERGVVSTVSIPGRANGEGAQFFVCVAPQPLTRHLNMWSNSSRGLGRDTTTGVRFIVLSRTGLFKGVILY